MTDRIKALINAYGAACARVARAPRLSPAQDEALRLERVAHDALVAAVGELHASLAERASMMQNMENIYAENKDLWARLDASLADARSGWDRYENANRLQVSLQLENAELRAQLENGS